MKTYVIGDIHGAYKALLQVIERSGIDRENDKLVCLGDVCDGWSETIEVIRELATFKNLIYVIGNHDQWFIDFMKYGATPSKWLTQGGYATLESFQKNFNEEWTIEEGERYQKEIMDFFNRGVYYYVDNTKLFIHGGFNWHRDIKHQDPYDLMWDRHLWVTANMWAEWEGKGLQKNIVKGYDEVFVGHTSTFRFSQVPTRAVNVWNLDQGAGWEGLLSLMDVDTKKYWQSDRVNELYPDEKGRRG